MTMVQNFIKIEKALSAMGVDIMVQKVVDLDDVAKQYDVACSVYAFLSGEEYFDPEVIQALCLRLVTYTEEGSFNHLRRYYRTHKDQLSQKLWKPHTSKWFLVVNEIPKELEREILLSGLDSNNSPLNPSELKSDDYLDYLDCFEIICESLAHILYYSDNWEGNRLFKNLTALEGRDVVKNILSTNEEIASLAVGFIERNIFGEIKYLTPQDIRKDYDRFTFEDGIIYNIIKKIFKEESERKFDEIRRILFLIALEVLDRRLNRLNRLNRLK